MLKRLVDRLQTLLYLSGNFDLALFVGRWGSTATPVTSPSPPSPPTPTYTTYDVDAPVPLVILDFDPTFHNNAGIDIAKEIALPANKYDVN